MKRCIQIFTHDTVCLERLVLLLHLRCPLAALSRVAVLIGLSVYNVQVEQRVLVEQNTDYWTR